MYQAKNKKEQEINKFYWLTLGLVSLLIIGVNVYMTLRKKPSIVNKAQPYLQPLPEGVDLTILDEISALQESIPVKPRSFYNLVRKYSTDEAKKDDANSSNINSENTNQASK